LTYFFFYFKGVDNFQVPDKGIIGNPVKIRDGPAAVIDDERCIHVTGFYKAGKTQPLGWLESQKTCRKRNTRCLTPRTREGQIQSAEKSGNPQIIY